MTRYAHQNGFHVERRFGWDCHGLPVEYEIDKTLGVTGPADVEAMGITAYNNHCRKIVTRYTKEWEQVRLHYYCLKARVSSALRFFFNLSDGEASGTMDRLRKRLQDDVSEFHGVRVVGLFRALSQRPHLQRLQSDALLHGLLDAVVELRGRAELQNCARSNR